MEAERREFSKFPRSLKKFIYLVKGQTNCWNKTFFNLFLEASQILYMEQLESELEKILGFRNLQEKVRKRVLHLSIVQVVEFH